MRLLGFTNLVKSAWLFSFLRCEAVLLATMNLLLKKLTQNDKFVRKQVGLYG